MEISDLWICRDPTAWDSALERYWTFVQPKHLLLERSLDELSLERLRSLDEKGWYDFLHDEYFRWKYTAANRYATTTRLLKRYLEESALEALDDIRRRLLNLDPEDIRWGLTVACGIRGLGTAGASGLLSLMYPEEFATVDQFVVKALRQVRDLPESNALTRMKPESLSIEDGVILITILRAKAADNNHMFGSNDWTPRRLDKVLWTYGR